MLYKKLLINLVVLCIFLPSFGQRRFIYHLNENLESVKKADAVFTGYGDYDDKLVKVIIRLNSTNKVAAIGHYTDSSLNVSEGNYQSFFENGKMQTEGNYRQNKEDGVWKKFDENGRLIDSILYKNGNKLFSRTTYYHKNTLKLFSERLDDYVKDTRQSFSYNESGTTTSEAFFTGNKGILKTYKDGITTVDSLFTKDEIEASFPGGEKAWTEYVKTQIIKNAQALVKDNKSGTCRIRFVIDLDGKIIDVEAITMQGTVLADVAINAIKRAKKWKPAMQYGRPVKAYREQPFTFTMKSEE